MFGPVAQWLEQGTHNPLVVGSTPTGPILASPSRRWDLPKVLTGKTLCSSATHEVCSWIKPINANPRRPSPSFSCAFTARPVLGKMVSVAFVPRPSISGIRGTFFPQLSSPDSWQILTCLLYYPFAGFCVGVTSGANGPGTAVTTSTVEEAVLSWFEELGYGIGHGPEIAPGEPAAERESFSDVVLVGRLSEAIVEASRPAGDRRCGVVWHTQGSGKSLTILFCAGQIILHPAMDNPTIVALTDRNDLDDQLFGQFQRCHELLRQQPVQAESTAHLRALLQVASGGVVFTTIQIFMPDEKGGRMEPLSQRRNIVVIADEAHRSQYDLIDGLARNMRDALPNASFIGFTGTPIEKHDANTGAVFGDYLSSTSRCAGTG